MRMRFALPLAGLMFASLSLSAQQAPGWKAGAALPVGLVGLTQWTHNNILGLCLDGGYQFAIPDTPAFVRTGVGVNIFPGKEQDGRKTSLTNAQFTADLMIPLGKSPLSIVTGVSLNAYRQNTTGTWTSNYEDKSVPFEGKGSSTVKRAFGKVGYRLGLEYTLTKSLAIDAVLQQTELGTDNEFIKDGAEYNGGTTVNPSWVQVGVKFSF